MSLYNIVQHVNDEVDKWDDNPDYQLGFYTNGVNFSVTSDMSEVLLSYTETPPDKVMVCHLKSTLQSRINILTEQMEALESYEHD